MLVTFKYFNFFGQNINRVFGLFTLSWQIPYIKFLIPLGISFFTLQAISYCVDVYFRKIKADKSIIRVALYMSFFPIIMEGPICRYSDTAVTLYEAKSIKYENLTRGYQRILWGLIKKIVIADRLNPFVVTVFNGHQTMHGIVVLIGIMAYTLQLYSEFSGSIDIVIGIGEVFGVKIPENFRQPFFSRTVSEFWRRWHITLGAFFKDYIFYPISLSQSRSTLNKFIKRYLSKSFARTLTTIMALFFVWLANGLWHGAEWRYIAYGLYYFSLISLGMLFQPYTKRLESRFPSIFKSKIWVIMQWFRTMVLVNFGMLIFRGHGMRAVWNMFVNIPKEFSFIDVVNGSLTRYGIDKLDWFVVLFGLVLLVIVSLLKEKNISIRNELAKSPILLRFSLYYCALFFLIIFGAYGYGYDVVQLIYANF